MSRNEKVNEKTNGKMNVYLDNGATTKTAPEVVEEIKTYLSEVYGNASSLHSFGRDAKKALENARKRIAKIINADPEEIIFTSGGTESNNLAIKGTAYLMKEQGKNQIITTKIEHPSVLKTVQQLEKEGFDAVYLDVDENGFINIDHLLDVISYKTALVSIMHANNEIGIILQLQEIADICKEKQVVFHTDAVQSFSKVPIDVKKTNIALLSASSHKIHGPKGCGFLFVKKGIKLKPLFQGGNHEKGLRAGTENIPGITGFAKAAELIKPEDIKNMTKLRDKLIKGLLDIPDTRLNGDREKRLCNNVSISFKFIEGESILMHLDMNGIAVSTGSACSSTELEPSHVLVALGLPYEEAHGTIRFTLSKYTTENEIDYTIKNVKEIVEKLRKISPLSKETER